MTQINQAGTLNTSSLAVPDLYVQIEQPNVLIQGAVSDRMGLVGSASWGPVNTPVIIGGPGDYSANFGGRRNRITDMGVAVTVAALMGVSDMRCVRVTDGTDVAAAVSGFSGGVTLVARYTGTEGNAITAQLLPQAQGATLVISQASLGTRTYAGIDWPTIQQNLNADPSALVSATFTGSPALTAAAVTLSGGTDGYTTTSGAYVGLDVAGARTGMYALRGTSCSVSVLVGIYDSATWSQQTAFGLSEMQYMVTCGAPSQTITSAINTLNSSGAQSPWLKVMLGDWVYYNDSVFGIIMVPPSIYAASKLAAMDPAQSTLNKQLYGVAGTQKSGVSSQNQTVTYSIAELTALVNAGIDVITNPAPGGSYWACRIGHNSSNSPAVQGDNYTRMTNFIAQTLAQGAGPYSGKTINDDLFRSARAALVGSLQSMVTNNLLALYNSALPYAVVCDVSNNPQSRTSLGYLQADVAVRYMGIVEKFIVNLQGGTTTVVQAAS